MARKRFPTPADLGAAWENFKAFCENQRVWVHNFNSKTNEYISSEIQRAITYTIGGFCVHAGLATSTFYRVYAHDPKYKDIVDRMREECEFDARRKFEQGIIPASLAALWMSHYGYSTKPAENNDSLEKVDALVKSITELAKKDV